MIPSSTVFDVYVTAPGSRAACQQALVGILGLYPLDAKRADAFERGERVLLRDKLSDREAQRVATSLRALGVHVEIQAPRASLSMVDLGSVTNDEPVVKAAPFEENPFFNVNAGLVGLDGEADEPAPVAAAPNLGALFGGGAAMLRDEDEPLAEDPGMPRRKKKPPVPQRAAPPPPVAAPLIPVQPPVAKPAPTGTDRFRPDGPGEPELELAIDRPPPDPMLSQLRDDQHIVAAPRCRRHDVAKVGNQCPVCDREERELRGKLFGGVMRKQPMVRLGIGVGAGLFLGFILTAPMARKGERAVAFIRDEAAREHQRPTEEAQAHAVALDNQADGEAQLGFIKTLGAWALITCAVTAGWFKLT